MDYPLAGLKVLDFSRVLAGPFAGRMLCDLGADVVKIEPPEGDVSRNWGKVTGGLSGYFNQWNGGKRSICIDMQAAGAVALIEELVKHADIVIENFRPDVMERLGINYESLSKINPALIMLSISGFGHGGSESHRPAYAPVIHAEGGLIERHTFRTDAPLSDLPVSLADTNAALHGLVGLLAALHMRSSTGKGQHIDIAMMDATVATDDQLNFELEDSHATSPLPNDVWRTGIGPILLSTDFRYFWRCISENFGVKDNSDESTGMGEKIATRREATAAFMMTLDSREKIVEIMDAFGIPWGDVRQGAKLQDQTTVKERNALIEVDDRAGGTRVVSQSPYRFSSATSGFRGPAPHQGEHNLEVLKDWIGASQDHVDTLREHGVLLTDEQQGY
jgi:crotonobetainyl-CoA:carnitine CoA-transferase CaiB-like acyl-CoA transferase